MPGRFGRSGGTTRTRTSSPLPLDDLLRRHLRRLVPTPIRRADLHAFRWVARTKLPVLGPMLPRLSRAADRSRLWFVIAALLAMAGGPNGQRAALRGVSSIAGASAVTNLPAKLLTGRRRPDLDPVPEIRRLVHVPSSTSFPSGHSASAFAFAVGVGLELPGLRRPLTMLATAVAFSRVYTGVHYPTDVIAGAAIGTGMALATQRVWPRPAPTPATADEADPVIPLAADGDGLVVVANVAAGNGLGPDPMKRLDQLLPASSILAAEPDEDLPTALDRAARMGRILGVAGGDGSVSAAAEVASRAGLPLAVIPAGTLNHLARDLGIESLEDATDAIGRGRVLHMDVGRIGDQLFLNSAHLGMYPALIERRQRWEGRIGKWPAMGIGVLDLAVHARPLSVRLDGHRRRVWMLFVGNGRFRGPGAAPTRRTRLDDGRLDVRVVHAREPFGRLRLAASLLLGTPRRSGALEFFTTDRLNVESDDGPLLFARDGEIFEGPTSAAIRQDYGALTILQPRR